MSKIPFDEKEMTIAYTVPNMLGSYHPGKVPPGLIPSPKKRQ